MILRFELLTWVNQLVIAAILRLEPASLQLKPRLLLF